MNNDEMHALYLPFVYPFIPGAKVNKVGGVLQSTARVRAGIVKVESRNEVGPLKRASIRPKVLLQGSTAATLERFRA